MIESNDGFYLGRIHDPRTGRTSEQPLMYEPDDLNTHAVVVGMTGSGKTGLCIDLLEEAALKGIPALMIDPKGDITNALLHFPDLAPEDFLPWVNVAEAQRQGKTAEQEAADVAQLWREGLQKWGISPERIRLLKESVGFAIYTPGSSAGLPISILASLAAPAPSLRQDQELLREKISGTATALLGLVGLKDIDPVRSREHILLANIFETAWREGVDLDLGDLIMQVQTPPFEKLGVFDIDRFFPEQERFELAMQLNNILASPSFRAWIEGEALDVGRLLYDGAGRPRHTIFYIAHLPEAERMFFVTLLYSAVEAWMHTQQGTTSLRAMIYFDEIAGFLPPVSAPPSKAPILRMLKQARAFGVSLVLAAQNPADIDYKALSNTGTWFVGKLATEQDKERLLDGLTSAIPGGLDRREYDMLISSLNKRIFLLRNVHEKQPQLFQTRWAMNYLAGPMTRNQIPLLNALAGVSETTPATAPSPGVPYAGRRDEATVAAVPAVDTEPIGFSTRPTVPSQVDEYFLSLNLSLPRAARAAGQDWAVEGQPLEPLYRPALLAQARVRFVNRKYGLAHEATQTMLVPDPDRRGRITWDEHHAGALAEDALEREPLPNARFASLEAPLSDATQMRSLRSDFADWVYYNMKVEVKANESLKVYAGPEVSKAEFRKLCSDAAAEKAEEAIDRVEAHYERKIDTIEKKLTREEQELRRDEAELAHRKREELGAHAETFLSMFSRRRRSLSTSLSKRRMTDRAKDDVEESEEAIAEFKKELEQLAADMAAELSDVRREWAEIAADTSEISVNPYKKDIDVAIFGVAWLPYYMVQAGDQLDEIPGFRAEMPA